MLLSILCLLGGLALLVWSSERFVLGASATARNLGLSPLIIGLTIVGMGTSAPEMFVSAIASLGGNPEVAVGNAIGSNIANIGLVIGCTAIVAPLSVSSGTIKREFVLMFAVILLSGGLLLDYRLERVDGVLLLAGTILVTLLMVKFALQGRRKDPMEREFAQEIPQGLSTRVALMWTLIGFVVLLLSSRMVVWGAVQIARTIGVSDLLIGLTVVAVGTSLPELAASITSALKGEPDIAIGNVIGSNIFNLLPVLCLPGLIAPGMISAEAVQRDYLVMLGLSMALFVAAYRARGAGRIGRWKGGGLLLGFGAYQLLLYTQAS